MKNNLFTKLFLGTVLLFMTACTSATQTSPEKKNSDKSETHWSYNGDTGPEHWGKIDAFSACADGTEQSPIDIEQTNEQTDQALSEIKINYSPTAFTLMNNGHTIQANDTSGRNNIIVNDEEYTLKQMHFHNPSEHQLNGNKFEMEGHLVHQNKEGQLAVLGFLIHAGNENKVLEEVWAALPKEKTEKDVILDKTINLENLLPKERKLFSYSGSLTTPPCSEGVKWFVLEQPIELSKEQINAFGSIFPHNSRPIQPLNERTVSELE
ncbi:MULTISPECIES: carbonic anhydrase [unclassified Cytobacillus]|uniref:carbonic anhydrase n=1 Tax=unclassified Cytobacillus TaxID=2675268 RepID=UPI00204199C9|nr:carbonic anhydrase family protein [Cytobacillus sp. AMY 15.2]MCM3092614.1 carbonic anhydrase family protein [Cytobacillus sp. AMY 15.2]